jgi:hypothetical protein
VDDPVALRRARRHDRHGRGLRQLDQGVAAGHARLHRHDGRPGRGQRRHEQVGERGAGRATGQQALAVQVGQPRRRRRGEAVSLGDGEDGRRRAQRRLLEPAPGRRRPGHDHVELTGAQLAAHLTGADVAQGDGQLRRLVAQGRDHLGPLADADRR